RPPAGADAGRPGGCHSRPLLPARRPPGQADRRPPALRPPLPFCRARPGGPRRPGGAGEAPPPPRFRRARPPAAPPPRGPPPSPPPPPPAGRRRAPPAEVLGPRKRQRPREDPPEAPDD